MVSCKMISSCLSQSNLQHRHVWYIGCASRVTDGCSFWSLTCCDTEASIDVVDGREHEGWSTKRHPLRDNQSHQWQNDDESGIQPVNMAIPVAPCHWQIRDVHVGNTRLATPSQRLEVVAIS